ncbi:venom acid phosphatase Acph-1-like [Diabrotica undecimpunctata]|uniref:venom acid phosphatase Acph-1-like n=1 Tax=Diabrotica undecimpunctata TaxID=50387 RepID=UPI003B635E45
MILIILLCILYCVQANDESLVAVHVLFRHGHRCPERSNLYKSSPYYNESYFKPFGFGELTNEGKLKVYNIGKEIRQRYSEFLDEEYSKDLINARTSDFSRSKESLQAMLAGLFPPTKDLIWLPGFNWQPISYEYIKRNSDQELFCFGCQTWVAASNDFLASQDYRKYDELLATLTNKTGEPYNNFVKPYYLYFGFRILTELNYTLPDWAHEVYPYPLKNLTLDHNAMVTGSRKLRQMCGGYLLKHILDDTQSKIDGKFPAKKMFIWSVNENNIVCLLRVMNLLKEDMIPDYGSLIVLELHNINSAYGFKIYFKNDDNEPELLTVPKCNNFCPLEKFKELVQENIPEDISLCRGNKKSSGTQMPSSVNYMVLLLFIYIFL